MGKVLVTGATGVVGSSVAAAFAAAGWDVHATARRLPAQPRPGIRYHAADLLSEAGCRSLAEAVGPLDVIGYCAVNEVPGSLIEQWTDAGHAVRNRRMLANLLDAILPGSPQFRQMSIIHGTKAYGVHLRDRRPPVPLRERMPRIPHDNFYYEQEDEVAARAKGQPWGWTVFRAPVILGGGIGTNLSSFLALGVLATIARARGQALAYPGHYATGLIDVVDADLIGRAFVWAADARAARNEVFNIANGEPGEWRSLWPVIAQANGVAAGGEQPGTTCAALAEAAAPLWRELVARHGLAAPTDLRAFLGESFALADFTLGSPMVGLLSTVKLRQAGFGECADTEASIHRWYERWRAMKLLPPIA